VRERELPLDEPLLQVVHAAHVGDATAVVPELEEPAAADRLSLLLDELREVGFSEAPAAEEHARVEPLDLSLGETERALHERFGEIGIELEVLRLEECLEEARDFVAGGRGESTITISFSRSRGSTMRGPTSTSACPRRPNRARGRAADARCARADRRRRVEERVEIEEHEERLVLHVRHGPQARFRVLGVGGDGPPATANPVVDCQVWSAIPSCCARRSSARSTRSSS
jgi:hypothetical protein